MRPLLPDRERPLVFAHRGCSSLAPENTMAAYNLAREKGAPGLELDIHVCATGELVVAHDDTFRRTIPEGNNAGGRVIETLPLAEIRALDVGAFFGPPFRGERPPLLEEVLEAFSPDLYIDIELKTRKSKDDPLPARVAKTLKSFGPKMLESVTVSSFNPLALAAFKRFCPEVPTAVIWCVDTEVPFFLQRGFGRFIAGCDYLKPKYDQVTPLNRLRLSIPPGRPLVPWTVDSPDLAEKMLSAGCAGIVTNRPQDMGRILQRGARETNAQ